MDAKFNKKRKKGSQKRQMLESMLAENTENTKKLKKFKKSRIVNKNLCSILKKSLCCISNYGKHKCFI